MEHLQEDLKEAKRQIDSILHKLKEILKTLEGNVFLIIELQQRYIKVALKKL